jgi:hypothetical protein
MAKVSRRPSDERDWDDHERRIRTLETSRTFSSVVRVDGSTALKLGQTVGGSQYIALLDRQGNTVVSDDTSTGQGLARPWLPVPWQEEAATSTSGTTFVTTSTATLYKQHPRMNLEVLVTAPASVTAEYRVLANNDGPTATLVTASAVGAVTRQRDLWDALDVPGVFGERVLLELQVRVAAGTGSVGAVFAAIWSRQS